MAEGGGALKILVTGGTGFIGASVVRNLLAHKVPVVIGEYARDEAVVAELPGADFELVDVADPKAIEAVFARHPNLTHCIHLAYVMSAEVEADMPRGVTVNLLGMVNMFEAALRYKLTRLVFTSSETVFGASQAVYGDRPVVEDDYCGPNDHFFTYGVMKILDEFMARKEGPNRLCVGNVDKLELSAGEAGEHRVVARIFTDDYRRAARQ
jgi:nucleoside-diphosphate-sugar epimerase